MAETAVYELDEAAVAREAQYDGFYAVCTNLDDDPSEIAKINRGRWEIEASLFYIGHYEFHVKIIGAERGSRTLLRFLYQFLYQ